MCRFAFYLGEKITVSRLVTEPTNSIIHQSFDNQERVEPLNGDGFGLAWYVPHLQAEPAVFRSITPAWSNANLHHLAAVIESRCIMAHIRAASPGLPVTELNCHPFVWENFAFMHNGFVGGYAVLRRRVLRQLSDEAYAVVSGTTDSEWLFAMFIDRYRRNFDQDPLNRMATALNDTIWDVEYLRVEARVTTPSQLNLAVSDGRRGVVTRFHGGDPEQANSLYVNAGKVYQCEQGQCRMVDPRESDHGAVIVASEQLSDDAGWRRVRGNHMVLIDEDLRVEERPIPVLSEP